MLERYLVVLLVKLGVVASAASILARSNAVKRMLLREQRTVSQQLQLALWFSAIFATGIATRVITRPAYQAVDLGLEGCLLAGVLGGYVTGIVCGILVSVPAVLNGEGLTMPMLAIAGVLGGLVRDCAPDGEDIWKFSPYIDLNLYRLLRQRPNARRTAFHLLFFAIIVAAEGFRQTLAHLFGPKQVFALYPGWPDPSWLSIAALYVTTVFAVTLPLKIWNSTRYEKKLEDQERLLVEARLEALIRQINPHFLFNTLNSVASLIRRDPDRAREMVHWLSNILRRLLRAQDKFSTLREEMDFVNDYLSIELVRFGSKLQIRREIAEDTMDLLVPSMLIQPLVENSIKHGLSSKVETGTIHVRSWRQGGRLHLVVEDDGVGIPGPKLAAVMNSGIGVSNVNERLRVLFGGDYRMWIDSMPEQGTRIEIDVPEMQGTLAAA